MSRYLIRKDSFLGYWLFWSAAVWLVAMLATVPGAVILLMGMGTVVSASVAGNMIMGLYIGGMIGLVAGFFQHRLMKHYFYVNDKNWWQRSALAGIPAGLVIAIGNDAVMRLAQLWYCNGDSYCAAMYGDNFFTTVRDILPMTVFIGIVSVAQWSVLRRYVDDAWLWMLANVVGGVLFSIIFQSQGPVSGWLSATLAQGAVTGAVMLWLFLHRAQPLEAPVTGSGSVWDEAI